MAIGRKVENPLTMLRTAAMSKHEQLQSMWSNIVANQNEGGSTN